MKDISENKKEFDLNVDTFNEDFNLAYIFWLKVVFGVIAGVTQYFLQRTLFYIGGFYVHFLFRGLLIVVIVIVLILTFQLLIIFLLFISKKKFNKAVPHDEKVWRYSFRFSLIFFIIFLISGSIALYIGL